MRPFIARFGISEDEASCDFQGGKLVYDVHREGIVLEESGELLASASDRLPRAMGSYITKARTDPTTDESTDR